MMAKRRPAGGPTGTCGAMNLTELAPADRTSAKPWAPEISSLSSEHLTLLADGPGI